MDDALPPDDAPSPSLAGFAAAIAGLGASDLKDARTMRGANPEFLHPFDGGPINEDKKEDGPQFPGEEFLYNGSAGGGGDTTAAGLRPGGGGAALEVMGAADSAHESVLSRFPQVVEAGLQRK